MPAATQQDPYAPLGGADRVRPAVPVLQGESCSCDLIRDEVISSYPML